MIRKKAYHYIEAGADIQEALYYAVQNNNLELVDYLVSKGANNIDHALEGAWHILVDKDSINATKHLIGIAQANDISFSFDYPIYNAIDLNSYDLLEYLIEKGADIDDIAIKLIDSGNYKMLDWFLYNYKDIDTLLKQAIFNENLKVVKILEGHLNK